MQGDIKQGFDMVLLVYPADEAAGSDDFFRRTKQMRLLFSRAALLK
jgi:hypothetical protein